MSLEERIVDVLVAKMEPRIDSIVAEAVRNALEESNHKMELLVRHYVSAKPGSIWRKNNDMGYTVYVTKVTADFIYSSPLNRHFTKGDDKSEVDDFYVEFEPDI